MEGKTSIVVLLCFLACLTTLFRGAYGGRSVVEGAKKLFVFGDSYVDTGNYPPTNASTPWRHPYGMTFPGKPSGRWSDGHVLPDYIALYFGLESPKPYERWRESGKGEEYGLNFAYGGTGVFNTSIPGPNLTKQINSLDQLVQENVFTKHDLSSSLALVSSVGNDYSYFLSKQGSLEHVQDFSENLTRQLSVNLKYIHEMGFPKVAVMAMGPLGCLPPPDAYKNHTIHHHAKCTESRNNISRFHNKLLKMRVDQLNLHYYNRPFVILDLYAAITRVLDLHNDRLGNSSFENPLVPCCTGNCGDVDESGKKEYKVCDDPRKAFFWDIVHPSQQGWFSIYSALKPSLPSLLFSPPSLPTLRLPAII